MRFGGSPTILTRAEVEAFLRGILVEFSMQGDLNRLL